jgi:hypothetical protein
LRFSCGRRFINYNCEINTWNNGRLEYWKVGSIFQFVKAIKFLPVFPVCRQAGIIPTFHANRNDMGNDEF